MRVKRGVVRRRKHNKVKKLAKGFLNRRKNCYKFAKDAVEKALNKDTFESVDEAVKRGLQLLVS